VFQIGLEHGLAMLFAAQHRAAQAAALPVDMLGGGIGDDVGTEL